MKGNVREQEKSPARKEVKKLSIEESVKVATGSGLISVNVSPLTSFTSRAIVGVYCVGKRSPNRANAPLLLRPFVRAREWECFVSGMNHGLSSRPMLQRLFSDLDTLQWTLFNNIFLFGL